MDIDWCAEPPCSDKDRTCFSCYCDALLFGSPFRHFFFCPRQYLKFVRVYGINIGLATVTAVLNIFLEAYSEWASWRELHLGRTQFQASTLQAQFVAQVLNTVFVGGHLFAGIFSDISPNWYKFVGSKLLQTLVIQCIFIVLRTVAIYSLRQYSRRQAKHASTQPDMNTALQGTTFLLAPRYGEVLNLAALAVIFAATMPVMLFVAAPVLLATYSLQLWELLKVSRKPPAQSEALADTALGNIPYVILLHLLWSLWAFSFYHVQLQAPFDLSFFLRFTVIPVTKLVFSKERALSVAERLTQAHSWPLLAAFVIILALHVLSVVLQSQLLHKMITPLRFIPDLVKQVFVDGHNQRLLLTAMSCSLGAAGTITQQDGFVSFNVAVRTHLLNGPISYTLADNPYYTHAFSTRHWNPAVRSRNRSKTRDELDKSSRSEAGHHSHDDRLITHALQPTVVDSSTDEEEGVEAPSEEWKADATVAAEAAILNGEEYNLCAASDQNEPPQVTQSPSFDNPLEPVAAWPGSFQHENDRPEEKGNDKQQNESQCLIVPTHTFQEASRAAKREARRRKIKELFSVDIDLDTWNP